MTTAPDTLQAVERYLDEVPRWASEVVELGPFTIFAGTGWPYYARPRLGWDGPVAAADVAAVFEWQRGHGRPAALEWVEQTSPAVLAAARACGATVHRHPLLVLAGDLTAVPAPPGVAVRLLDGDDPALAQVHAAVDVAFGHPGTAAGCAGDAERDAHAGAPDLLRGALRAGRTRLAGAIGASGAVGGGTHSPRGPVSEVMGVGVLPAYRRRGIGAAVTGLLAADALAAGVTTVLLSADDDDVARVYERIGFVRIGVSCAAED